MLGSGNNLSRGNAALLSSSSDIPPLSQCLSLDPIALGSLKYTRSGELRRALGVPPATTQEDHSFGVAHFKLTAPIATEELKHFKESVQDTSRKAKDRVRKFRDSIDKLDKYREAISSKKRQRTDISPTERAGGVNLAKIGSQVHRNAGNDILTQRAEDRAKNVGLNKRIRTSVADVRGDSRAVVNARQQKGAEKDGDALSSINGSAVRTEEKIRRLPAGGEGWDTKMKKKRSAGIVGHRVANGDQDVKRAMQQKIHAESKLRSCDALGFRSKSSPGVSGIHKLDGSFEPAGSDGGTALRNEPESIPLPRVLEQRVVAKGSNKASLLDDNLANSPNRMLKAKVSRAPRTSSIMVLDSSSHSKIHHSSGAFPSCEQPASVNKIPALGVGNNKKYAMPMGSSSPMAQWGGQRPNKNSRTKRANLVSPVSNLAEPQISSPSFATPDFSARTSFGGGGSVFASSVDNVTLKVKKEPDNVSSPFGLSESEESGAGDNKLKDKAIENGEVAVPMSGVLLTRKNKISTSEIGDGASRPGRVGSSAPLTRPAHPIREKSENLQAMKPIQTARSSSDKHKSKSGRPPSKKMRDCKASTRVGSSLNAVSSDLTGESDDDHKELFTAASSARNASSLACSGSFWKKMELIFANISLEDASHLKQQLSLAEELDESLSQMFGAECNVLGVVMQKETPNCYGEGSAKANSEGRVDIKKLDKVTPLYQRVLSALIEEDENDEFYHHFEGKNMSLHYASDDSHCGSCNQLDIEPKDRDKMESEVESNADFQSQKSSLLDGLSCNISVASNTFRNSSMSNSLHSSEQWLGDDGFSHSDVGPISEICSHDPAHPQSKETNVFSVSSSDVQYQFMSLDDKILLELHSIGLYPETLPDLAEGEEAINQNVMELNEQLYQQVQMKKRKLGEVDKAIQNNRDVERRNVEHVAMDQLIQIAYRKRVPSRGGNSSKSAVRKVPKQVALAFINRTLARYRKFEEAGISCFSDPVLQDVMFATLPCSNDAKSTDCVGSGTASNTFNETSNLQTEARASGAVSSTFERYDSSDALPSVHSSEHGVSRHGFMLKRKKELLIDDVVGSASSRITSSLEGHVNVGIRGKRSERERDQSRENMRNSSVSGAGASLDSFKGERKAKTKPKQKNSNLSTSGNGVQPGYPDAGGSSQRSMANASNKSGEVRSTSMGNFPRNSTKDADEPVDFSKLNELDVAEELGGNQDLGSWLHELDGLQDIDTMGLEIPMDDLSDLKFAF
ncbi:hypothetical protein SLA2020_364010 [Shorea laevis]